MVTERTQGKSVRGLLRALSGIFVGGSDATKITQVRVYSATIDPASVAINTVAEQTFTVTGLTTGDKVVVNPPSLSAGLGIAGARVSAANTLAINFVNPTGAAIDQASGTWEVIAFRS